MNERGISQIIATVLIIMLSISAFAILVGFVVPFVKNSLNKGTECLSYKGFYKFYEDESINLNCFEIKALNYIYSFSIKADSSDSLKNKTIGFKLVFVDSEGNSKAVSVIGGEPTSIDAEGISIYGNMAEAKIKIPQAGEIMSYKYNGGEIIYKSAEVYPILNSKRTCAEQKEEIILINCK